MMMGDGDYVSRGLRRLSIWIESKIAKTLAVFASVGGIMSEGIRAREAL